MQANVGMMRACRYLPIRAMFTDNQIYQFFSASAFTHREQGTAILYLKACTLHLPLMSCSSAAPCNVALMTAKDIMP